MHVVIASLFKKRAINQIAVVCCTDMTVHNHLHHMYMDTPTSVTRLIDQDAGGLTCLRYYLSLWYSSGGRGDWYSVYQCILLVYSYTGSDQIQLKKNKLTV